MPALRLPKPSGKERVLAAAGGFTGLWALTWLGAASAPVSAAVTGGLAVGSVMASSGLTLLWWKARAMTALTADEDDDDEAPQTVEEPAADGASEAEDAEAAAADAAAANTGTA